MASNRDQASSCDPCENEDQAAQSRGEAEPWRRRVQAAQSPGGAAKWGRSDSNLIVASPAALRRRCAAASLRHPVNPADSFVGCSCVAIAKGRGGRT